MGKASHGGLTFPEENKNGTSSIITIVSLDKCQGENDPKVRIPEGPGPLLAGRHGKVAR